MDEKAPDAFHRLQHQGTLRNMSTSEYENTEWVVLQREVYFDPASPSPIDVDRSSTAGASTR